jgi:DNA-binding NarL/FixJ family response regulator
MVKLLLADDHQLLIDGLRPLLEQQEFIETVDIAKNGLEAIDRAAACKPDVILLDISMPGLNGIDAARRILHDLPDTKIIMLSMHADRRFVQESLGAGVRGYILKESAVAEVIRAIRAVLGGEYYFSAPVQDQALREYITMLKEGRNAPPSPLSQREREVLQLIAEGKSTKEAAAILSVSVKTIESHRKQIMDKLDLHSVAELTKYAIREGLTRLE